jgi:short-subunit dehydrogenase
MPGFTFLKYKNKMKKKQIALITGATSGIGRAYAVCFAKAGYDLIITGRRIDKLRNLAHEMREVYGICVHIIKAELSEDSDTQKLIKVIEKHNNITVLVNNAGFGSGVEFCKNNLEEHMRMLQVHVVVSVKLVYAVLPQMLGHNEGTIINVSSLGAYMPAPGSSMYSATKLFLTSFSESLYMEVHKQGIRVQCVCPGFTHTDFHERRTRGKMLKTSGLMWMEADAVAEKSIKSLRKHSIVFVPGLVNKLLIGITSLIPRRLYYYIMERSGKIKVAPGFFDRIKQLVKKPVPFLFTTHADQV